MKKNCFLNTIANRAPKQAIELLKKEGYKGEIYNPIQLYTVLEQYVVRKNDAAIMELTRIHPDAKTIIKGYLMFESKNQLNKPKSAEGEEFENCGGCAAAAAGVMALAADGEPQSKGLSTTNILIISGAVVLSMALISMVVLSNRK